MAGTKTPHKNTGLETLKQIRIDNYIGICGQEFDEAETDELIIIKEEKKSRKALEAQEIKERKIYKADQAVKQRHISAQCSCGMKIRTTRKWILEPGLPDCACGGKFTLEVVKTNQGEFIPF